MKSRQKQDSFVEVMDTTLRDGEQTPGVSFTPAEKLEIARLLLTRVRVDRLEIGSARVSEGEREAVRNILGWAEHRGYLEAMEILGFIDGGKSVEWVRSVGGRVINLLAKGSENHCRSCAKRRRAISTTSSPKSKTPRNRDSKSTSIWRTGPMECATVSRMSASF